MSETDPPRTGPPPTSRACDHARGHPASHVHDVTSVRDGGAGLSRYLCTACGRWAGRLLGEHKREGEADG